MSDDDQDNQSGQSNPYDTWLQNPAIGISPQSFNQDDSVAASGGNADPAQWSFNPIDPSKVPPPDLNLPPNLKYGKPNQDPPPPPTLPDWFWTTLPKTNDDTPEWRKWQKAVKDWCEQNHVDLGPIMDMAKDKLNKKKTDDPNDDGVQPDHKPTPDDKAPHVNDGESDTKTSPTTDTKPPDSDIPIPPAPPPPQPGDYNVPDDDTANV